jgi:hypothetical protein
MHLSEHENQGTFAKPRFHEAGAPGNEIEITPEMIEAGVREFCAYDPRFEGPGDVVVAIWGAMIAVSPRA